METEAEIVYFLKAEQCSKTQLLSFFFYLVEIIIAQAYI